MAYAVTMSYDEGGRSDLHADLKWIIKGKCKMKDVGRVDLRHKDWGISLAVYDKEGRFVTNCAM